MVAAVEDNTSRKQVDVLRAQELNQLSKTEREQVLFEVHGVSDLIQEEPSFVECKLVEFDEAVAKLSKNSAYGQAALSSPEYVQKTEFRLMFLRGDAFEVATAATRMISFFEAKMDLFGPERLSKDITLRDLDEGDLKCLKTGCTQELPIRDKAGRAVMCSVPSLLGDNRFTIQNRLRAVWYVYNSAIKDIEVQKRGFVWVHYAVGNGEIHREAAWKIPKLVKALPVRAMGLHSCASSTRWQIVAHLAMLVGGQRIRTHLRLHFGTHKEVQHKLATFGVPCPVGPNGEPRIDNFLEIFKMWQKRDLGFVDTKILDTTLTPGPRDVLLGRQKLAQEHMGNLHFRIMVDKYRDAYNNAKTRLEKTEMASKIVCMVKENNGRFLKMEDSSWVEVDDMTAREKVSHTFRNRRSTTVGTNTSESSKTEKLIQKPSKVRRSVEDGSAAQKLSKKQRKTEDGFMDMTSSKTDDDMDSKGMELPPQAFEC